MNKSRIWIPNVDDDNASAMVYFHLDIGFKKLEERTLQPAVQIQIVNSEVMEVPLFQNMENSVVMYGIRKAATNAGELYEGDIVKVSFNGKITNTSGEEVGVIVWDKNHCRFVIWTPKKKRSVYAKRIRLLGNIFENDVEDFGLTKEFASWQENFYPKS